MSAPVDWEPLIDFAPLQLPAAVQALALVEDQVNVALLPLVIEVGLAEIATVGAGGVTETVVDWLALLLPVAPVQVRV